MDLFGSTQKIVDKTKNGKTVSGLKVSKVALKQCH